jgi:arylsulfatase A-like enzyme
VASRVALLVALLALALPSGASALERPNIILVLTDDQDASAQTISKMPYLSRRDPANGGGWYRFDNAFINNPTCCPSRATILTGRYSHHTGVEVTAGIPRYDDSDTIATRLDAAGYRTGYVGKYHLGTTHRVHPGPAYEPPGWDDWQAFAGNTKGWYYDYTLNENGTLVNYGHGPADYSTDVLAKKALAFINRSAGRPFFLVYAPRGPHNNWIAAPRYLRHYATEPVSLPPDFNEDTSDKPDWWAGLPLKKVGNTVGAMRKEWDTLLAVDDALKAIHKRVEALHLMRNTVILYMSDNGYSFGEHRWSQKRCVYDSCTKTPLYVKFGGHNEGYTFPEIVGNQDLAATFADLAGTAPPGDGDGQSMVPFLTGHGAPAGWQNEELIRSANPKNDPKEPPDAWGIKTPDYLYAETTISGERELYDLRRDPWEMNNVASNPAYAMVEEELAARLELLRGS